MVNINGEVWTVLQASSNHPAFITSDGQMTIGCCDNARKIIYLYEGLGPEKMWRVIVHEVTHAFLFMYGYELDTYCHEELIAGFIELYGEDILETAR